MRSNPVIRLLAACLLLLTSMGMAQQDTPPKDTSGGAIPPIQLGGAAPSDVDVQTPVRPDTRPLSGILGLTLGSSQKNILSLHFDAGQAFDSNPGVAGGSSDYEAVTSLQGRLNLQHPMRRGNLNLDYSVGALFYNGNIDTHWFPQLDFSVPFALGRWTITLAEQVAYTPESVLGGTPGFTDFGAAATGVGGINTSLTPQQNILTPVASRLSNTSAAQVQYGLSPRSSWTAGVAYGNLYFPDDNLQNTHQISGRTGYNRSLTAKDTVSVLYEYSIFRHTGGIGDTDTHSPQLAYARRVTGRLSVSVSGGPQLISRQLSTQENNVSWTVTSTAQYQARRNSASLSYLHGVSGGEGIFQSATSDSLQAGITRILSRTLSLGVSGTLSKTTDLGGTSEFRSGGAGIQVRRTLGRRASVYFNYAFQRQISDGSCNAGVLCLGLSRQVFGFGIGWGPRPWVLK